MSALPTAGKRGVWKYLQRKLGIEQLERKVDGLTAELPMLDARHRAVLTAVESALHVLKMPTVDDSLVMFHLRCMGYCGGWKAKEKETGHD